VGHYRDERAKARPRTAMTFLARSLALSAVLTLLPGAALASPSTAATASTLAALQTVAVANDSGAAQALAQPGTTQVTVVVSTTAGTPAAVPAPTVAPEVAPPSYTLPPYYDRIHSDRKSGRGLLIGGLSLGVLAYVYTSLAGAVAIDKARDMDPGNRDRADRRAYGRALLVPGIGPALAIPKADTAVRAWAAGMAGLTQAVALTMTVVGIHRLGRARRYERLSVGAMASSQGGHVSLGMRF
jgi:hypothetical protein